MGFLKFLVWTTCAVGLGIFLASADLDGRTPLEHLQRAWKRNVNPSAVDRMKNGVGDAFDDVKDAVGNVRADPDEPRERHSDADRAAVNRILARKK